MAFEMRGFKAHDMCSECDCSKCGNSSKNKGHSPLKKQGPCWKNYKMVGTKKKGGRTVPNCVPKKQ